MIKKEGFWDKFLKYSPFVGFIFAAGVFYATFNSLESTINVKLDAHEKYVNILVSQQTNRIQNLENVMIGQYKNVTFAANDIKEEVIKNRKIQEDKPIHELQAITTPYVIRDTVYIKESANKFKDK